MGKITQIHKKQTPKYLLIAVLALIINVGLLIILPSFSATLTFMSAGKSKEALSFHNRVSLTKVHPLPPSLLNWQDPSDSGDYFNQITPVKVGYLVWSKFPITVAITAPNIAPHQADIWIQAVLEAVEEWNHYLPLKLVQNPDLADITIIRKSPPLQGNPPRARSAQATYNLYSSNQFLHHKFTILISPSQTGIYLLASARHELGHALGIWGHSPNKSDSLYFSQIANPPVISIRDVNTLKRVYEQPTDLGWMIKQQ